MKRDIIGDAILIAAPDAESRKAEYCLCASCKNSGICKYYSKFIEYQQAHFPAKIDCYKYEKESATNEDHYQAN